MNREEAINVIKGARKYLTVGNPIWNVKKVDEAFDMAIEALQAEYEDYEHATLVDIKEPLKVSVVRCKDCRYGEHIQIHLWGNREIDNAPSSFHNFIKCHKYNIKGFNETLYLNDDDFCSHGERRK